jgi:transposase
LETDPTRMCALLVGLRAVRVLGVGRWPHWLRITIETTAARPNCAVCDTSAHGHGRRDVTLVDLPAFGRPTRLVWSKRRWRCPSCRRSWTETDPSIGSSRCALTARAGRWATVQVGRHGRSVADVAVELGCDWHTVMDAVTLWGRQLIDDPNRFGVVDAVGLDETLCVRVGRYRTQVWSTQIVDVRRGQLLDVIGGRRSGPTCAWFAARPDGWCERVRWATLDLSAAYRTVFDTMLPDATQVADPYHVVALANRAVDETRRRVQNETTGHRGRNVDPLYRVRRRLITGAERLTEDGHGRLLELLADGDPDLHVFAAWAAKELVRRIYTQSDAAAARAWIVRIAGDFAQRWMPLEVRRLGRTLRVWIEQIVAWHDARVSNGPTEAINNLIKRVKRVAFGFRRFDHYRTRALLYAGKPNWALLNTLTPP